MTKARNMADIVGGGFAIPSGSLGNAVPADGSITTAKLADDAVTSAKLDTNIDVTGDATFASGIDVTGTTNSDIVKIDTGSEPAWDTHTRFWGEAGFGARYDSFQHRFDVGVNRTEAMRIQSNGTILLGRANATANTPGFLFNKNGNGFGTQSAGPVLYLNRTTTTGTNLQFRMNNSPVGAVNVTATSTSYATSSDYRLKENVADITGATDRLKQLNPVRFNFIVDPDTTVDGFLAHEVQSVVPEAVTGTHNEVDDDGNAVMQGIDQSKIVPLLVATIREQQTAIEALTARVTALEAD
jgi:hypothetical protein